MSLAILDEYWKYGEHAGLVAICFHGCLIDKKIGVKIRYFFMNLGISNGHIANLDPQCIYGWIVLWVS